MSRNYHGPSAEPGLTAEEYRETMDEYYAAMDELTDYPDPPDGCLGDEEEATINDD